MEPQNLKIKNKIPATLTGINEGGEERPFVVLLPGFLDSKDYKHLKILADDLAEEEVTSLRFNPMGTWNSAGEIQDYTISQYKEDLEDVIDFIAENENPESITLVGHSIGGMMSLISGKVKRVDSIVAIMPTPTFTKAEVIKKKLPKWKEKGTKISTRDLPGKNEKIKFEVPYSFVKDASQYDAIESVSQYQKPLLLIAGGEDESVTVGSVRSIYKAANSPKEFKVLEGIEHDYRIHQDQISKVNSEIINFLKETGVC